MTDTRFTEFEFDNAYSNNKRKKARLKKNDITILVGRNGYGKSSFLQGLKQYAEDMDNAIVVEWNDNEHGRGNAMSRMGFEDDLEGLASMICRSEGQRMLTVIGRYFLAKAGYIVRHKGEQHDTMFLLLDQLDSGLDIAQLNRIKNILRDTVIPDMNSNGLTVYTVISANSFELVNGEYCLDPVTRTRKIFKTLDDYTKYITNLYDPEDID